MYFLLIFSIFPGINLGLDLLDVTHNYIHVLSIGLPHLVNILLQLFQNLDIFINLLDQKGRNQVVELVCELEQVHLVYH